MSADYLAYRCAECGFLIPADEPRIKAADGWRHPTCIDLDEITGAPA